MSTDDWSLTREESAREAVEEFLDAAVRARQQAEAGAFAEQRVCLGPPDEHGKLRPGRRCAWCRATL